MYRLPLEFIIYIIFRTRLPKLNGNCSRKVGNVFFRVRVRNTEASCNMIFHSTDEKHDIVAYNSKCRREMDCPDMSTVGYKFKSNSVPYSIVEIHCDSIAPIVQKGYQIFSIAIRLICMFKLRNCNSVQRYKGYLEQQTIESVPLPRHSGSW